MYLGISVPRQRTVCVLVLYQLQQTVAEHGVRLCQPLRVRRTALLVLGPVMSVSWRQVVRVVVHLKAVQVNLERSSHLQVRVTRTPRCQHKTTWDSTILPEISQGSLAHQSLGNTLTGIWSSYLTLTSKNNWDFTILHEISQGSLANQSTGNSLNVGKYWVVA